jgi:N-acetylglucosaminyldiphosphoundecaprenol N-acetyl-beta-D-mannosaminyltransferase
MHCAGKGNVLGILIDAVDYDYAVQKVLDAAQARRPAAVSALAVHGLMTGVLDREQKFRLNKFDLLVPDGQPVRWVLNWLYGAKLAERRCATLFLRQHTGNSRRSARLPRKNVSRNSYRRNGAV